MNPQQRPALMPAATEVAKMGKAKKSNEHVEARAVNGRGSGNENNPWVSNYPPLAAWLEKIEACCVDQIGITNGGRTLAYLEKWIANGRMFLIEVRADRHGWNVYTAPNTSRIDETLADAETRLGWRPTVDVGG